MLRSSASVVADVLSPPGILLVIHSWSRAMPDAATAAPTPSWLLYPRAQSNARYPMESAKPTAARVSEALPMRQVPRPTSGIDRSAPPTPRKATVVVIRVFLHEYFLLGRADVGRVNSRNSTVLLSVISMQIRDKALRITARIAVEKEKGSWAVRLGEGALSNQHL